MSVTSCFSSFVLLSLCLLYHGQICHGDHKMLGMYLDTLIIGLIFFSVFSIIIKLTLQKELQNGMTNNVLLLLPEPGIESQAV